MLRSGTYIIADQPIVVSRSSVCESHYQHVPRLFYAIIVGIAITSCVRVKLAYTKAT